MIEFPTQPTVENLTEVVHNLLDLLNSSQEGILVVDQDGKTQFANRALLRFLEIEDREVIGRPFSELLPEADADIFQQWHRELFDGASGTTRSAIFQITESDIHLEVIARHKPEKGNRTYFYFRDITARVRIEKQLRERNAFYDGLIDSSVDGIIAADMKGNIILFNKGAQNMLGYTEREAIETLHTTRLYPEGTAREILRKMRSDENGGKGKCLKHRLIGLTKNGREIPISLSGSIIYDPDGNEIASFGIFTDLSEIEKIQARLREKQMELIQSEKMASLGKLAAGVAHEINNPLSGVLIYANLVLEELDEKSPLSEDMERIIAETTRCKTIVRELLDFARQDDTICESADINTIIEEGIHLLRNQAVFHNVEIDLDLQPDLPSVFASGVRLNQVVLNLTLNAAEAMDGNGTLSIATCFIESTGKVRITVSDTGPGIPEPLQSKIFDPFFTTKEVGKGTGLGLSVSYRILKDCNGTIELKSSPGNGATFIIELPTVLENKTDQIMGAS